MTGLRLDLLMRVGMACVVAGLLLPTGRAVADEPETFESLVKRCRSVRLNGKLTPYLYSAYGRECKPYDPDHRIEGSGVQALTASSELFVFDAPTHRLRYTVPLGLGWGGTLQFKELPAVEDSDHRVMLIEVGGTGDYKQYVELQSGREWYLKQTLAGPAISAEPEGDLAIELCLFGRFDCERIADRLAPLQAWQGTDSHIAQREYDRILTQADWDKLWKRHRDNSEVPPSVDFSRSMVIAIFTEFGLSPVRAVAISRPDSIEVYFVAPPGQFEEGAAITAPVTPFGIYVLPRSTSHLVLKERGESKMVPTGMWDTVAEFERVPE